MVCAFIPCVTAAGAGGVGAVFGIAGVLGADAELAGAAGAFAMEFLFEDPPQPAIKVVAARITRSSLRIMVMFPYVDVKLSG